jgi:hypothetical protein
VWESHVREGAIGLCPVCFTRRRDRRQEVERIVRRQAGAALEDWLASD